MNIMDIQHSFVSSTGTLGESDVRKELLTPPGIHRIHILFLALSGGSYIVTRIYKEIGVVENPASTSTWFIYTQYPL